MTGHIIRGVFLCLAVWLPRAATADEPSAVAVNVRPPLGEVRPMVGVGYSNTYGGGPSGWGYQAGARAELMAGPTQSFGLEANYVVPVLGNGTARYLALGVVLEQQLWDWFNASIGTIGYLALSGPQQQPFGVVTNLGWSPTLWKRFRPFVTYRAEWIFASPVVGINSLSVGLTVNL